MILVALAGPQGSGKTTASDFLKQEYPHAIRYGIKSTFPKHISAIFEDVVRELHPQNDQLAAYKNLQRAVSTWAEKHVHPDIWSLRFQRTVLEEYREQLVIADDIRLPSNCKALDDIAKAGKKVVLFQLEASEEVRKSRASAWREVDYLEVPLVEMVPRSDNFKWIKVNAELPWEMVRQILLEELHCLRSA